MLEVIVNGEPVQVPGEATVADLLRQLAGPEVAGSQGGPPTGVAVALGDDVVPAGQWTTTRLCPGDRLEILGAVAGG
ncbi:sulfur carrier protein ThiS [Kineosporia sp. NBRC 101731]|uniref:sulfur carrier protein ThiS n=1 Tax=Kineosporia sp. NBRC 101731 TaxID=3032199 RepID=UPI0024A39659|nr:sulfur carrier protein ThiS [Kineosporia sp. NBRC 101731]GLY29625.1 thiamine biosynthesis protein ThiS [Kineosporia sp. NBRC 101731]